MPVRSDRCISANVLSEYNLRPIRTLISVRNQLAAQDGRSRVQIVGLVELDVFVLKRNIIRYLGTYKIVMLMYIT